MALLFTLFGQAIIGGALVGLALVLFRILTGRTMSTSRMIGSLLGGQEGLAAAGIAFVAGVAIAPTILITLGYVEQAPVEAHWLVLAIGGALVGLGVRLGDSSVLGALGGLARASGKALAAICAILVGVALSFLLRQVLSVGGVA